MESSNINTDACCGSCNTEPKPQVNDHAHDHDHGYSSYWRIAITVILLATGYVLKNHGILTGFYEPLLYVAAYLPVGWPVLRMAWNAALKGDLFTEFSLMSLATIGAMSIGEYAEGVSVMFFYTIGELFQEAALKKARRSITALLSMQSDVVRVWRDGRYCLVNAKDVQQGEKFQLLAGEKLAIDAILLSSEATFNLSAITGESLPVTLLKGDFIPSGAIQLDKVIELQVKNSYNNSTIARMMHMVQEAATRKAPTELFIRKFSRIYTPAVAVAALAIVLMPSLFLTNYVFRDWLYRALVFLVISCPCALVISIPLSYFGGIGAASRRGIMFKGGNYIDALAEVNCIAFDKTGTLTKGKPNVVVYVCETDESDFFNAAYTLEKLSTHPVAAAIAVFCKEKGGAGNITATHIQEFPGKGISGKIGDTEIFVGNTRLLDALQISYPSAIQDVAGIITAVAVNRKYVGHFVLADKVRDNALSALALLSKAGIKQTAILSGDKKQEVERVAAQLGIQKIFAELLPDQKVHKLKELKEQSKGRIAFVGDGINDAPSLALSDVGIAMGGIGSDIAVETADVVIQNDDLQNVVRAIKVAKVTVQVARQNVVLAIGVKLLVLGLGAAGMASMWAAVFADVGVALLAILNATSIQFRKID